METRYVPKELVLFYVAFLTVQLYIQLGHFIIVQVILPTAYHQDPSNFMLGFKRLRLNLLSVVTLLTLKIVLGCQPNRLKTILTIFKYKFVKVNPHRDSIIFVPTFCAISKQYLILFISILVMSLLPD